MGWLFLLLFGSLVGYSLYMQLLRDLGPAKAGSFAFVSPIIAVLVGTIVAGETVQAHDERCWRGRHAPLPLAPVYTAMSLEALFARIACNATSTVQKLRAAL